MLVADSATVELSPDFGLDEESAMPSSECWLPELEKSAGDVSADPDEAWGGVVDTTTADDVADDGSTSFTIFSDRDDDGAGGDSTGAVSVPCSIRPHCVRFAVSNNYIKL